MSPESSITLTHDTKERITLSLKGSITSANAASIISQYQKILKGCLPAHVVINLEELVKIDDYGVAALAGLRKMIVSSKGVFQLSKVAAPITQTLNFYSFDKLTRPAPEPVPASIITQVGADTLTALSELRFMLGFLGDTCFSFLRTLGNPSSLRMTDTIDTMRKVGVDALPIVGLISFLLGLIMAFMSSVQLKQFGANIYVASLVGLSMTRELGPIMTAIIVAGRSASAFAAEIGSMKISEEIDALFTMGIDPHQFLVLPRIIASCLMVPLLVLFSDLFAIAGGLLVGITMLDLTIDGYIHQTINTLSLFDVFWGVFKGGLFAFLLSWIGCLRGFQVKEGAAGVGLATTSAVVSSIFLVILCDSILVVILRYWQ